MVGMATIRTMATATIALSSIATWASASSSSSPSSSRCSGFAPAAALRRSHRGLVAPNDGGDRTPDDRLLGRRRRPRADAHAGWRSSAHAGSRPGLYRKFHDYAWDRLNGGDGESLLDDTVPEKLRSNSSPVKNAPPGTNVVATLRSASRFPFLDNDNVDDVVASSSSSTGGGGGGGVGVGGGSRQQALRLSRTAFLETCTPEGDALITNMTIHVLNFVSFPNPRIRVVVRRVRDDGGVDDDDDDGDTANSGGGEYLGLPIFGADIVSLPGNRHLVALDFQPVLPPRDDDAGGEGPSTLIIPERYSRFDDRLRALHSKYQGGATPPLPWGGDIPGEAARFFSPHALWTRLGGAGAADAVGTVVWEAYREYVDLYLELMRAVQDDVDSGILEIPPAPAGGREADAGNPVWRGQADYLEYRRANDPARPMLRRLYGTEWSERVIGDVLFPDL
jgi:phycoerythrobilin:ferredoxin oxidoreductase